MFLSVVIPAYNEEKNISNMLGDILSYFTTNNFEYEVVVVDDGSRDSTLEKARGYNGKIKHFTIIESSPNMGKGYALKKGMLAAHGDNILFLDADGSTAIKELDKFFDFLAEDYDIVIASRRVEGSSVKVPFKRKILGEIYILFARIILGIKVSDINCGFKIFKKDTARKIFSKQVMNDWSFDAEDLFLAGKDGCRIKEIPVKWVHKDTSKVRPLRDGIKSFTSLIKIKLNDLRGKYR